LQMLAQRRCALLFLVIVSWVFHGIGLCAAHQTVFRGIPLTACRPAA
jgi:hypothetical protein